MKETGNKRQEVKDKKVGKTQKIKTSMDYYNTSKGTRTKISKGVDSRIKSTNPLFITDAAFTTESLTAIPTNFSSDVLPHR